MNVSVDSIFVIGGAAAVFVKIIVDVCRMVWPTAPGWLFPLLALLFSPACLIAFMALGDPIVWDQRTFATIFLGSIACAGIAVGSSAIQQRADDKRRGQA